MSPRDKRPAKRNVSSDLTDKVIRLIRWVLCRWDRTLRLIVVLLALGFTVGVILPLLWWLGQLFGVAAAGYLAPGTGLALFSGSVATIAALRRRGRDGDDSQDDNWDDETS